MAKKSKAGTCEPMKPSKAEMRRWKAEDIARDQIQSSPEYKKAVRAAERVLMQAEKVAKDAIKGK